MSVRKLFWRTTAFLITGLLLYVWFGIVYLTGGFQDWIYKVLS